MQGVTTPCTLLWGPRDPSHKYTDPLSLHELIPEAEIVRFYACGHFPDVERPEHFAAILIESMAKNTELTQSVAEPSGRSPELPCRSLIARRTSGTATSPTRNDMRGLGTARSEAQSLRDAGSRPSAARARRARLTVLLAKASDDGAAVAMSIDAATSTSDLIEFRGDIL